MVHNGGVVLLGTIMPSLAGGTSLAVIAAADDRTLVLDEEKWTRYDPGPGLIGRRRPGPSTCCG
jgi:hypothetical protein